ncbi:MAG: DUF2142 domain-containing protein [Lachnospiraceae bacterium]|nr:DUF2142 domain-containing protein [Lachnospiraceae bacterium]
MRSRLQEKQQQIRQWEADAKTNRLPVFFRILVAIMICLTTAVLLEFAIFQFPALRYKEEPIEFQGEQEQTEVPGSINWIFEKVLVPLTEDETKSILVERNSRKLLSDYYEKEMEEKEDPTLVEKEDGTFYRRVNRITLLTNLEQPYYIHECRLHIAANEGKSYGFSLQPFLEHRAKGKEVYCSIDPRIRSGVAEVRQKADRLEIVILSEEEISPEQIHFSLSNDFSPNPIRILWILFVLLGGAMILECRQLLAERPEWCFVLVALALGLLLIVSIGTNQVSYDEHVHARAAYKLSFGSTIETTETAMRMSGNQLPMFHNLTERMLVANWENENHDYSWADIGHQSRWVRAEDRVYYPLALGFFLGRILGLSFPLTVALAKLFNLLTYIAVCFFAIRMAKKYKELVALLALLPGNLFQAASISYDMVVNAFLLMGCVLLYNEFLRPAEKLEWQNLLLMLFSFVIGSLSKPIYILMACMLLFYGKKKFHSRWQEWILKLSVLAIAGLMLYNIFRPTPVAGSDYTLVSNISFAGDKRNVGSSVIGQVQYIFSQPFAYATLLLSSMGKMLFSYLLGGKGYFQYGYVGESSMFSTWMVLVLGIGLAFLKPRSENEELSEWEEPRKGIGLRNKILTVIMTFGMCAVIWTSMYVSYTSVGANEIRGVQGRYFAPLFLPILICFLGEKKTGNMGRVGRSRLLFTVMGLLNAIMIWRLIIGVYDL